MSYNIINKVSSAKVPAWGNTHQFIAIHYLGCVGQNYDLAADGCGAHFTIYWDGSIYQRCDYNAVPWAVGTAGYYTQKHPKANNYSTISIELCCKCDGNSNDANDPYWYFTTETQNAAVWLVQKLMKDLNIPIENVLRHFDIVNKWCPSPYCRNNKYKTSWTWDEFKSKVAGKEITSTPPESMTYFVRKTFSDSSSQLGAYSILANAKKMVDQNPTYKVFDANEKVIYEIAQNTSNSDTSSTSTETDKMWLGWTKRETGSAGLRCIHGDAGKAYGLQFDYRYGLVPFMKYCVEYNSARYSGFNSYIALGAGNSKLIYNAGLGKLWQQYYDAYTSEFEQLQLTCAYQQYYLPSRNYILSHYGFDIGNCHPSVKGTLWSMSFRSGTETAAKKFYACKGKSDEAILNNVYPTYGNNDGGRWTKAGQWGDAVSALKNNTYSIVNVAMSGSSSSTPSKPSTPTTSKTPYRVATSYSGGKYVGQIDAYNVLDNAKKRASETSQSAKKTYYVYDNTGTVVYTAKYESSSPTASGKITKVSEWISTLENWGKKMIEVGAVYNNSGNKTDYTVALKQKPVTTNCALFCTHALEIAGLFAKTDKFYGATGGSLKGTGVTTLTTKIGKIVAEYPKANTTTDKLNLVPGDIVTYYEQHTNVYVGTENGKKVWIDAGRGTSVKGCTGSTWKSFKRTGEISGMHVAKVIRLNLTDDVSKKDTTTTKPSTSISKKLYDVKVTITDLRIRETPNGTIKGYIKPGVYGITEEKTVGGIKWGHLLSGSGWIALDYVTKL